MRAGRQPSVSGSSLRYRGLPLAKVIIGLSAIGEYEASGDGVTAKAR